MEMQEAPSGKLWNTSQSVQRMGKGKTQEQPFSYMGQEDDVSTQPQSEGSISETWEEPVALDTKPKRKPGKKTNPVQSVTRVEDLFTGREVKPDDN